MEHRWKYHLPILAGWYWWQRSPASRPEIVELIHTGSRWLWVGHDGEHDDDPGNDGRWSGPIVSPNGFECWPE